MTRHDVTPRDLLFGLLALQVGLIDQDQLVGAFSAWSRQRGRLLAEILCERGALDVEARSLLEAMARKQLEIHGGDPEKSLASLAVGPSTRQRLAEVDGALNASLVRVPDQSPTAHDDATTTITVGTTTGAGGRFRVLRPYARGGLGAVFVALDGELNREVALKRILEHHADDPTSRTRFLLEAEITGGLEHPGIVPVYGLGMHADGRPYYAMRFIRGERLKEAIAAFHGNAVLEADPGRRSLALRGLLRRFVDVCNAIEYAHSRGILHRDLKPGNVIVGRHGETLVVDWGLAKAVGRTVAAADDERTLVPSSASGTAETLPGSALGTPAYMSPEQAAGDLERLGPRSEVYSLGATLYCLLTGRAPFDAEDVGSVLRAVQRGQFPPPRQMVPWVDTALEAVCLKAMATDPEARYASARALAEDVERWSADEPVTAWREPWSHRLGRWGRRNRPLVTGAAAAVLVALAGLMAVLAVQRQSNRVLASKNRALDRANTALRQAVQAREAANTALGEANARVVARFELAREAIRSFKLGVEQEEMLQEDRLRPLRDKLLGSARHFYDRLGALLKDERDASSKAVLAESCEELARLIDIIGQKVEALAVFKEAVALRRELAALPGAGPLERVELARALIAFGEEARQLGDNPGALAANEGAVELVEPLASGPGSTVQARRVLGAAYLGAGLVLQRTGAEDRAMQVFSQSRRVRESLARGAEAVADDHYDLAITIASIAHLHERRGKVTEALVAQREAMKIRHSLATDHPEVPRYRRDLALGHNDVGALLRSTGDLAGALTEQRKSQELLHGLAAEHPAVSDFRRNLASSYGWVSVVLEERGDLAAALVEQRKFQELMQALADDHPGTPDYRTGLAVGHSRIGKLLEKTGDLAGALAEQRKFQELMQTLAAEHPDDPTYRLTLAVSHNRIGTLLGRSGDLTEALAEQRKNQELVLALATRYPDVPNHRRELVVSHHQIGALLERTGDLAGAMAEYREGQTLMRGLAAEYPEILDYRRDLAVSLNKVGILLERAGHLAEALAVQRENQSLMRALATQHPDVPDHRFDLASSGGWVGRLLEQTGDVLGALTEERKNQELMRTLFVEHPDSRDYTFGLAASHNRLGNLLSMSERPSEALVELERAGSLLEALIQAAPNALEYRNQLAIALCLSGDPLRDLGRVAEARERYQRGLALAEQLAVANPKEPAYSSRLADGLRRLAHLKSHAGDDAGAAGDARRAIERFEGLPTRDGRDMFRLACAHATLAAAMGAGSAEASTESDRAVASLREAAAKSYRNPAAYHYEPALHPLRDRPDFRLLMLDLTFPAEPFANPRSERAL
jgi:serine/threonine-protein kinase